MGASSELKYGVCNCEYPCSCVEFRGKRYGSWKGIIDEYADADSWALIHRLDRLATEVGFDVIYQQGEPMTNIAPDHLRSPVHKAMQLEEHVAKMMAILDPTGARSSTDNTPHRVARMFLTELCSGYETDIEELFEAVFPNEGSEGMVVVHDIPLYSLCEHHWLLIIGKAHVGYLPNEKVLGLSKVARVVDAFARRLQLQERLTRQVADAIDEHLDSKGVIVVVEAEHHCLSIRGAQKPGTITTTTEYRGVFEQGKYQDQFFRMIGR